MPIHEPKNIILYGPPGTGKTHETSRRAVELCGEQVPETWEGVRSVYSRLVDQGRIEFVTFHQSMSYEDFVEGRQPTTDSSESGGFRLEVIPGIFQRFVQRACENSYEISSTGENILIENKKIFKMSTGSVANGNDDYFFEDAVENGCVRLNVIDMDVTDNKYSEYLNIRSDVEKFTKKPGKGGVKAGLLYSFRNAVNKGDIVVIVKGNTKFRAVGEFTGEYEYRPREETGYAHYRSVKWRFIKGSGLPASNIYDKNFSRQAFYPLHRKNLKIPALQNLISSDQSHRKKDYVLIIDEINRANISKVLGELITLLEADKRIGAANELMVKLPYSGENFGVPANLHIIGTMNTADRSIALIDTALRRRFTFEEMMPKPDTLSDCSGDCEINLPRLLTTLNERIEYLYDREHQIGHAYFISCRSREDVDKVMREKVIPLLAEYFFEDWNKVAAILGDLESGEGPTIGGFMNRVPLDAPKGVDEDDATSRVRWQVRSIEDGFSYDKLLLEEGRL